MIRKIDEREPVNSWEVYFILLENSSVSIDEKLSISRKLQKERITELRDWARENFSYRWLKSVR